MNNKRLWAIFLLLSFFLSKSIYTNINNLSNIEISANRFAPQIFMEFTKPLYVEKSIDTNKMQLQLEFPGMSLTSFKQFNVVSKLKNLKDLIKNVQLFYKKVPSPRVVLVISFSSKDILVRWYKLEDSGKADRLILDIFNKNKLKNLQKNGNRLLYAYNDSKKKTNFSSDLINLGEKKNLSILIDAGHGGIDDGARGFFLLKEKDIALDISRRASNLLKKNGFKVYLTRNGDQTLTLLERSELASQLNADLFISIHVNADIHFKSTSSGIETYYLKESDILPPRKSGGFLFVNNKSDLYFTKVADKLLNDNVQLSKYLASSIHNSVLNILRKQNINTVSRGLKQHTFRVLLRGEVPVVLIEVGFLTNKEEAKKLASSSYRQLLAEGITQGIKNYIYSYSLSNN